LRRRREDSERWDGQASARWRRSVRLFPLPRWHGFQVSTTSTTSTMSTMSAMSANSTTRLRLIILDPQTSLQISINQHRHRHCITHITETRERWRQRPHVSRKKEKSSRVKTNESSNFKRVSLLESCHPVPSFPAATPNSSYSTPILMTHVVCSR
jgi:hypothetical protein